RGVWPRTLREVDPGIGTITLKNSLQLAKEPVESLAVFAVIVDQAGPALLVPQVFPLVTPDQALKAGGFRLAPGEADVFSDGFQAVRADREVHPAVDKIRDVDQAVTIASHI